MYVQSKLGQHEDMCHVCQSPESGEASQVRPAWGVGKGRGKVGEGRMWQVEAERRCTCEQTGLGREGAARIRDLGQILIPGPISPTWAAWIFTSYFADADLSNGWWLGLQGWLGLYLG